MAKQLALDFSRERIRALEIDGSPRNPRIRAFGVTDTPMASVGEDADELEAAVLADLLRSQKFPRDPAAASMGSRDCTFREMDLPFTTDEQIRKVIKYEAESHLHLVDIDDVVIDFFKLREGRDGTHLLVMAYEKAVMDTRLRLMDGNGVDPLFADLHLMSVYRALDRAGYFESVAVEEKEEEDGAETDGARESTNDFVMVLECDHDVSHLLVVCSGELLAARAIPVGVRERRALEGGPAAMSGEGASPGANDGAGDGAGPEESSAEQFEDEEFVLVDDAGSDQFYRRLRREVQRSLFPLGLAEEIPRFLLLGPLVRDQEFVQRVGEELGLLVEVARPFDRFDHDLDEEVAEIANAEGAAALGVALRMLDGSPGVDFRQEEVRYARRFDQLKVALSCGIIMALIAAFLFALVDLKKYRVLTLETQAHAVAQANPYLTDSGVRTTPQGEELNRDEVSRVEGRIRSGKLDHYQAIREVRKVLDQKRQWLGSSLGRVGAIPQVPSGLEVLKEVIAAIENKKSNIGRVEINLLHLDLTRATPTVTMKGWVDEQRLADQLKLALMASPVVLSVSNPKTSPNPETGRIEITNLDVELKPEYSVNQPRSGRR